MWPAVALVGWDLYVKHLRPKPLDAEWQLYEQAALLIGWLLVAAVYWRAVRSVRAAIREFLDTVEGK